MASTEQLPTAQEHRQWLGRKIRWALEPDEPRLIDDYLDTYRQPAHGSEPDDWQMAESAFQLLLDSAADIALPWHWRSLCLDHSHRPLRQLQRLAVTGERKHRLSELRHRLGTLRLRPSIPLTEASHERKAP